MMFEHRADRRLRLKKPAPAMTPQGRVAISDVSTSGIALAHDFPLKVGDRIHLEFSWNGIPMRLNCTVAAARRNERGASFVSGMIVRVGESAILYKRWVSDALNAMIVKEAAVPSRFAEA